MFLTSLLDYLKNIIAKLTLNIVLFAKAVEILFGGHLIMLLLILHLLFNAHVLRLNFNFNYDEIIHLPVDCITYKLHVTCITFK